MDHPWVVVFPPFQSQGQVESINSRIEESFQAEGLGGFFQHGFVKSGMMGYQHRSSDLAKEALYKFQRGNKALVFNDAMNLNGFCILLARLKVIFPDTVDEYAEAFNLQGTVGYDFICLGIEPG